MCHRMYVNIEDWVSRQTGQPNEPFLVSQWQHSCSGALLREAMSPLRGL